MPVFDVEVAELVVGEPGVLHLGVDDRCRRCRGFILREQPPLVGAADPADVQVRRLAGRRVRGLEERTVVLLVGRWVTLVAGAGDAAGVDSRLTKGHVDRRKWKTRRPARLRPNDVYISVGTKGRHKRI